MLRPFIQSTNSTGPSRASLEVCNLIFLLRKRNEDFSAYLWLHDLIQKLKSMSTIQTSKVKLYNGIEMPWLGLGVFRSKEGQEVENAVKVALEAGYRSIDTAAAYQNERGVGKAITESGIPRKDIFLTTKIWNSDQGYRSAFQAFEKSLDQLQTEYIDLYLIHWPKGELSSETWKAMEELYEQGRIRAIGVSNFLLHHLVSLMKDARIIPMVNQVEFHPRLIQPELLKFCQENQ